MSSKSFNMKAAVAAALPALATSAARRRAAALLTVAKAAPLILKLQDNQAAAEADDETVAEAVRQVEEAEAAEAPAKAARLAAEKRQLERDQIAEDIKKAEAALEKYEFKYQHFFSLPDELQKEVYGAEKYYNIHGDRSPYAMAAAERRGKLKRLLREEAKIKLAAGIKE